MKLYLIAFKILTLIYNICLYFLDYFIILSYHSQKTENKILIIRLDAIGDFVLWLDAAKYFKQIYPDKKIILLGNTVWTDLAKRFPFWHEVWSLDRCKFKINLLYRFHLLRKIRKAGFEAVIQPSYSRAFLSGDDIIRISGARERIGSVGDFSNIRRFEKRVSDRFYTRLIPTDPKPFMELKRNAEFMCGLGINMKSGLPDLSPAIEGVSNQLSNLNGYYILFPAASLSGKQWPITHFSVLADKIYRKTGLIAIICGSSNEQSLAKKLICHVDAPVVNMMGKTNLVELAVVIRDAAFLVGNDTSAMHFAAAVSTPAFCLLGGGHYGRFMPYDLELETERPLPVPIIHEMDCFGCNWKCRYSVKKGAAFPCIANISVDEVFALLRPVLEDKL